MARTPALWRFAICDLLGNELQSISRLAVDVKLKYRMNRPASLEFSIDGADPRVGGAYADGLPYLTEMRRTLKAWRSIDAGTTWRPRYTGIVYQLNDVGDTERVTTKVASFSFMQRLVRRLVRDANGNRALTVFGPAITGQSPPPLAADMAITDGAQIAKTIVDRTNSYGGPTGISTDANLGAQFDNVPDRSMRCERKRVAEALVDLTSAFNGFDLDFVPVDRTDGTFEIMSAYAKLGVDRSDTVVFAYDAPPHNCLMSRLLDGDQFCNDLDAVGGSNNGGANYVGTYADAPTIASTGRYEDIDTFNDITVQGFLDDLAHEEVNFRRRARELVAATPVAGRAWFPWDDFYLGDYVGVVAGPALRGGFDGLQRVYGFDLTISNENVETIDKVYTAPDTA